MSHSFRICPKNNLLIEWKVDLPDAGWCFYLRRDTPNETKRCLAVLRNNGNENAIAQPFLLELTL